ncbi:uncharacterized protein LOC143036167 [Oratosquilla oratoria]|uniref:uncharacterized protein LOC143036167 n=1 Tax=Oratosquilla oratoria TaxID=337810 RepID=UPI003F76DE9B
MRSSKVILLVLSFIFSLGRCQCPPGESCTTAGVLPVPSDATLYKFCLALGATPSCYKCPEGEIFVAADSKCVFSGIEPTTDGGGAPTTTTTKPLCSEEPSCTTEGIYPHQRCDCGAYYTCILNTKGQFILREFSCVGILGLLEVKSLVPLEAHFAV